MELAAGRSFLPLLEGATDQDKVPIWKTECGC
jgi:hypothetical protein